VTDSLSRVFSALADPTRRDLVARLAAGDATVGQLAAPYRVTVQAVSKHVKVLERAGLVTRGRDAQRRPCRLRTEPLDRTADWIDAHRRRTEERYDRLEQLLHDIKERP
jgi:DNA-binding transcriptional ArsR family regulator